MVWLPSHCGTGIEAANLAEISLDLTSVHGTRVLPAMRELGKQGRRRP